MLKLLLIDSDTDNLKNFTTYIKANFPEIKNITSLSDQFTNVLDTVKTLAPQLIIADIRFFGPRSVDTIRTIYERYPRMMFVLYGGYNDADYIKQCLDFGVVDYMFKPVKQNEFSRSLAKAFERHKSLLEKEFSEKRIAENFKENVDMFETIFISNILNGHLTNPGEIKNGLNYFKIKIDEGYTVFIVRIDHFKKIVLTLTEDEKQILSYKVYEVLQNCLRGHSVKLHLISLNSISAILGGRYEFEEIVTLCEEIKNTIYEKADVKISIGIGRTYDELKDISTSYREADGALRHKFNLGYNSVIPIHYVEPLNHITYRYPIEKEEKLVYSVVAGEYDYCVSLLRDILDSLKNCEPIPPNLLPKIIMDILISISRYATERSIPVNNQFTTFFPSKEIFALKSIDEAYIYLSQSLKSFCKYILDNQAQNHSEIVDKTKKYLEDKYFETLNISKIAIYVGTTPEYLGKVFYDAEKKTVHDYMVFLRMEQAKKLMRDTKFADDVIAVKVGYDDEKHFKSMFRKVVGVSVADYRLKNSLIKPL